jgi:hypothetical protein
MGFSLAAIVAETSFRNERKTLAFGVFKVEGEAAVRDEYELWLPEDCSLCAGRPLEDVAVEHDIIAARRTKEGYAILTWIKQSGE